MDFSSYTILDCAVALQLQCCSFTSHRFLNPLALILSDFTILFISEITFLCNDFVAFLFFIVLIEILHGFGLGDAPYIEHTYLCRPFVVVV